MPAAWNSPTALANSPTPTEQRRRLELEMAEKERIYGERYPIDEDFLAALALMPQACGIALGLDRLVMLATGASRIEQVLWNPLAMKSPSATLRTIDELCESALVPRERLGELAEVAARYAVAITPAMADAIDRGDPHDPIARQFVPDARELDRRAEESGDPIGDDPFSPVEGVVHRYPDRVLLKVVNVCAVYCRFCFRREMVGRGGEGCRRRRSRRRSNTSRPIRRSGKSFSAAAIRSCFRRGGSRTWSRSLRRSTTSR